MSTTIAPDVTLQCEKCRAVTCEQAFTLVLYQHWTCYGCGTINSHDTGKGNAMKISMRKMSASQELAVSGLAFVLAAALALACHCAGGA